MISEFMINRCGKEDGNEKRWFRYSIYTSRRGQIHESRERNEFLIEEVLKMVGILVVESEIRQSVCVT